MLPQMDMPPGSIQPQQPAKRAAKIFIVIDDGNKELIEELLHTTQIQRLTPNCLLDDCPLGKVPVFLCQSRELRNRLH